MARTPPRYHKGRLRERLVREAARLIAAKGLAALSMRRLAGRVGASRAAAYHHFAGKDALLAAVGEDGFRRLLAAIQEADDAGPAPLERLRRALRGYLRFALRDTEFFRLMFANVLDRPVRVESVAELRPFGFSSPAAFAAFGALVSAVKRCQADGVFGAGDPLEMANALHAYTHGVARLAIDKHLKGDFSPEDLLDRGLDAMFRGLAEGGRRTAAG